MKLEEKNEKYKEQNQEEKNSPMHVLYVCFTFLYT